MAVEEATGASETLGCPAAHGDTAVVLGWVTSLDAPTKRSALQYSLKSHVAGKVKLEAEVFGLDHRQETLSLGTVTVKDGQTLNRSITLSKLPLKGVSHATRVVVKATLTVDGEALVVSSPAAFVHFSANYATATAYNYEVLVTQLDGGHISGNGLKLVGRVGTGEDVVAARSAERAARQTLRASAAPAGANTAEAAAATDDTPDFELPVTWGSRRSLAPVQMNESEAAELGLKTTGTDAAGPVTAGLEGPMEFPLISIQTICPLWTTSYADAAGGDFAKTDGATVAASAAKAAVLALDHSGYETTFTTYWEGTLDRVTGCIMRMGLKPDTDYVVAVESAFEVVNPSNADERGSSKVTYVTADRVNQGTNWYYKDFRTGTGSETHSPELPQDAVSNVSAVLSRLYSLNDVGWRYGTDSGGRDLYDHEVGPGGGTCYDHSSFTTPAACTAAGHTWTTVSGTIWTGQGVDDDRWKFMIAHEVGHRIQSGLMGTPNHPFHFLADGSSTRDTTAFPDHPSAPPMLRCDHVDKAANNSLHCYQSLETTSAASGEGWAHFIATKIWANETNKYATFNYYKPYMRKTSTAYQTYKAGQTMFPWMAQKLAETYAPDSLKPSKGHDYGVEGDWLQFLWAINRMPSGTTPVLSMNDIDKMFGAGCGGDYCDGKTLTWTTLRNGAKAAFGAGSARANMVESYGKNRGVRNY